MNILEVFDPVSNSWSTPQTSGTFSTRKYLTASVVNNKIYAIGGYRQGAPVNILEVFDPATNNWSSPQTQGTFTARYALSSVVIGGKIYVIGGFDGTGSVSTLEVFDPSTNSWSTAIQKNSMTPRHYFAAATVGDKIYIMGGTSGTNGFPNINTVEMFDPSINTWSTITTTGSMTARFGLSASVVNGVIYTIGGATGAGAYLNTFEAFEPLTNTWSKPAVNAGFTQREYLSSAVIGTVHAVLGPWPLQTRYSTTTVWLAGVSGSAVHGTLQTLARRRESRPRSSGSRLSMWQHSARARNIEGKSPTYESGLHGRSFNSVADLRRAGESAAGDRPVDARDHWADPDTARRAPGRARRSPWPTWSSRSSGRRWSWPTTRRWPRSWPRSSRSSSRTTRSSTSSRTTTTTSPRRTSRAAIPISRRTRWSTRTSSACGTRRCSRCSPGATRWWWPRSRASTVWAIPRSTARTASACASARRTSATRSCADRHLLRAQRLRPVGGQVPRARRHAGSPPVVAGDRGAHLLLGRRGRAHHRGRPADR